MVIVRSPILHDLLRDAIADGRLALQPVDGDFVARTQAAGFRQRREDLAYRLNWPRFGVSPRKRVAPSRNLPARRVAIYTMRTFSSASSHQMFALARCISALKLYVSWSRLVVTIYHAASWLRKSLDRRDRPEPLSRRIGHLLEQSAFRALEREHGLASGP